MVVELLGDASEVRDNVELERSLIAPHMFSSLSVYCLSLVHQFVHVCLFLFNCLNDCSVSCSKEKKWLKLYLLVIHPLF